MRESATIIFKVGSASSCYVHMSSSPAARDPYVCVCVCVCPCICECRRACVCACICIIFKVGSASSCYVHMSSSPASRDPYVCVCVCIHAYASAGVHVCVRAFVHENNTELQFPQNIEPQFPGLRTALRPRYYSVTQCTGHISANARSHQLHRGDRECGYYMS